MSNLCHYNTVSFFLKKKNPQQRCGFLFAEKEELEQRSKSLYL
jgi:hypothetical protein